MKLICTDNLNGKLALTEGKTYDAEVLDMPSTFEVHEQLPTVGGYVLVENDIGVRQAYIKSRFRNEKKVKM